MVYKDVHRILIANDWVLVRVKGSHYQYKNPEFSYCITVPNHNKKDLSIGVIRNIEKGTGLALRN